MTKSQKSIRWTLPIVLVLVFAFTGMVSAAEKFPSQNFTGIIFFGAGGTTDILSRAIAPLAKNPLGRSIVMNNKPGAAGALGMQYVYDQPADGYTLLFGSEPPGVFKVLGSSNLDYSNFEPIIIMALCPSVICVPKDSPFKTLDDLFEAARKSPGKINIGSTGPGGGPFCNFSLISQKEKLKFNMIHYDGEGPMAPALMGNQLDATSFTISAGVQYFKAGTLRPLAVMASKRLSVIPDVPTIVELKPQYAKTMQVWPIPFTVSVKKETPKDAVNVLVDAFQKAYNDEKYQTTLKNLGLWGSGVYGKEASDLLDAWKQNMSWILWEAGAAKFSPEKFGIPKPN